MVLFDILYSLTTGTVPSSMLQKLKISGGCLESTLFQNGQFQCYNLLLYISANGKSIYSSLIGDDSMTLEYIDETLRICFISSNELRKVFGDVKEVFVQESCTIDQTQLCADSQSIVDTSYVHIFGNKGILTLSSDANETGLFH